MRVNIASGIWQSALTIMRQPLAPRGKIRRQRIHRRVAFVEPQAVIGNHPWQQRQGEQQPKTGRSKKSHRRRLGCPNKTGNRFMRTENQHYFSHRFTQTYSQIRKTTHPTKQRPTNQAALSSRRGRRYRRETYVSREGSENKTSSHKSGHRGTDRRYTARSHFQYRSAHRETQIE